MVASCVRYPTEYVVASTGAADRCFGHSMTYLGLEKRWVGLDAHADRRTTFLEGVVGFIVRRDVGLT